MKNLFLTFLLLVGFSAFADDLYVNSSGIEGTFYTIQEAVDAPRIHHQWYPDQIDYERFSFTNDTKANLGKMGHKFGKETSLGRAQCILIDSETGLIWGASDPRSFGKAIGY